MLTLKEIKWPTALTAATRSAGCDTCPCSTDLSNRSLPLSNFKPHGGAGATVSSLIWLGIQRHSNLSPAGGASLLSLGKKTFEIKGEEGSSSDDHEDAPKKFTFRDEAGSLG